MANIEDFESAPEGDDTMRTGILNLLLSADQLKGLLEGCAVVHNHEGCIYVVIQLDNGINQPIRSVSEFNQRYMRGTND